MNNLNSILLEGTLAADPSFFYTAAGEPNCNFQVNTRRYSEAHTFDIRAENRLAEVCMERLKAGRGVRVVGTLRTEDRGETPGTHVYIYAEHVEFKPVRKPEPETPA